MSLVYLGANIQPLEDAVVKACNEARRMARSEFPNWRIAHADLPEMPSASGSIAKFDMWLPRAIAEKKNYEENHTWWTVTSEYACGDSSVTLPLYLKQEKLLKDRGLWEIYLECLKVTYVIGNMENVGITYATDRADSLREQYGHESDDAGAECIEIAWKYPADDSLKAGAPYELELPKSGNNKSLTTFIFEKLKLPIISKSDKTGKPSLDKTVMKHYADTLPEDSDEWSFVNWLLYKRKRDTYAAYLDGYDRYAVPIGIPNFRRLYPSVNPTGSDTLRMSSSHPNEQNIGKQEDDGSFASKGMKSLRYCFGPVPGREWYSIDYENLELKIPAYESGEQVMIDVFEKPDDPPFFGSYHLLNASIVYPDLFWPIAEKKGEFKKLYAATWYQWIKNFGFAKQYGAQQATADRAAHKQGAFDAVESQMQCIAKLNQQCIKHANKYGYVETIPDKEINPKKGYPLLCRRSSWGSISPTLPLNYRVQGTACWIMMRAMIKVQEYLDRINATESERHHRHIIMNVHDELVFDFPKCDPRINLPIIRKIRNIMASLGDCVGIPLTCGVTLHSENWSKGLAV